MNICGIIAEYNPFHNGHKLHIAKTREAGASHIVCVMSGSFVQRGDIAIMDKWSRAEMAIKNGADLVVELPVCYSLASANTFANAGVFILSQLGATSLSFGSECGDIALLKKTALAVSNVGDELAALLKSGVSYPTALQGAIADESCRNVINSANNTLGIEYINAIAEQSADIQPITVKREQAEHDSLLSGENIASATLIRSMIAEGRFAELNPIMPPNSLDILIKAIDQKTAPVVQASIESMLIYKLKTMSESDFLAVPDVIEGLENRLYRSAVKATSFTEFLSIAKTKRYTMARLRRIAYCCLLGITKEMQDVSPQYIRVLATNQRGHEILNLASKTTTIPIVTKFKALYDSGSMGVKCDALSTDVFSLAMPTPQKSGMDFIMSPIQVK